MNQRQFTSTRLRWPRMFRPHIVLTAALIASVGLLGSAGKSEYRGGQLPQPGPPHGSNCLTYEPVTVELTGTILRKTFPGAPNYESIAKGDAPEVEWLLMLSSPVCVNADAADPDIYPARRNVREIQLAFPDAKTYERQKNLVGKSVTAKGTLFGSHTGHHHTAVVLTVTALIKAGAHSSN
jgi:hypothetical protein